jgi:hypothetical protein
MVETIYTRSITTDFGGNRVINLHPEIVAETGITTTLLRVDTLGDAVYIVFDSALSGGEETLLNTVISNHDNNIQVAYKSVITVSPKNTIFSNTTYSREYLFVYKGSDKIGTISKIEVIGYMDNGVTSYSIKIGDKTNNTVIAENTFTNTTEGIVSCTPISNIPTGQSIIEIFIKKTGGIANQKAYVESINLYIS